MTTLLDAGPLVSILNTEDAHHEWAVHHARRLDAPFLTCEAVLSEAHFLLQDTSGGRRRLIEIAESDQLQVPFSYTHHAGRVNELMRTYSDLPMSFADACLVRMTELHNDGRVFTVDSDFRVYRKHGDAPIPPLGLKAIANHLRVYQGSGIHVIEDGRGDAQQPAEARGGGRLPSPARPRRRDLRPAPAGQRRPADPQADRRPVT